MIPEHKPQEKAGARFHNWRTGQVSTMNQAFHTSFTQQLNSDTRAGKLVVSIREDAKQHFGQSFR